MNLFLLHIKLSNTDSGNHLNPLRLVTKVHLYVSQILTQSGKAYFYKAILNVCTP